MCLVRLPNPVVMKELLGYKIDIYKTSSQLRPSFKFHLVHRRGGMDVIIALLRLIS